MKKKKDLPILLNVFKHTFKIDVNETRQKTTKDFFLIFGSFRHILLERLLPLFRSLS